ncbi:hypothetical protein TVAG_146920 [Trichomonas vaginalis G3]|uniref:Uncharacterized protein n=1 Tax=Trichomonas vaginalis (strain ATCC PRA-98 / G3) TaxID=412133 RepID=A2DKZ6_TRIV3|nr:porin domain-containing protein [Trichomonas vaginalis G3]EAY18949.1 hypothetical protein TVAG_146920 [Trichomonas vaginalis G3]KAI5532015.1 porin domain-containing protein [Trichomonas vaginalis G3]|eukprot:XP_001579935.1 hypothetical protein [Trichomonas vaginalis G3]
MKQLKVILAQTKKLFNIPIQNKLCFNAPVMNNNFSLQLEKPSQKDVQMCVTTNLKFKNGLIVATAHSDNPCSILFQTNAIYPGVKFTTNISSNEKNTIISKVSYCTIYKNMIFTPKVKVILQDKPYNYLNTDVHFKTNVNYYGCGFTALFKKLEQSFTLIPYIRKFGHHAISLKFKNYKVVPEIYTIFPYEDFQFAFHTFYPTRSLSFYSIYHPNLRNLFGANFTISHIGHGPEYLFMIGCSHNIGNDSSIRYVLRSDSKASFELNVPYKNFLKMTFTGNFEYSRANKLNSNFGAVIIFDKK